MIARKPSEDPRSGDVLAYAGWTISVVAREGDSVRYTRSHPDKAPEGERTQDIAAWRAWASGARVVARARDAGECVVFFHGLAGPCTGCRELLGEEVHVVEGAGILHPQCCRAKKHQVARKKVKEQAA